MNDPTHFEIPNRLGLGDGTPFLVDVFPFLEVILGSDDPPRPFAGAEDYWRRAPLAEKRMTLGVAYCEHPLPSVRWKTIEVMRDQPSSAMGQVLVNRLADGEERVRNAAAACLWSWYGDTGCRFPVLVLRDEIRGYTEIMPGVQSKAGLVLGHEAGLQALDFLVRAAPTPEHRRAIEKLVKEEVIIEERIRDVDTRSIRFVGTEQKGENTYEVYRAKNKAQALAFLKTKTVTKPFYYIEVETMEGNVGRDVEGIYEI